MREAGRKKDAPTPIDGCSAAQLEAIVIPLEGFNRVLNDLHVESPRLFHPPRQEILTVDAEWNPR